MKTEKTTATSDQFSGTIPQPSGDYSNGPRGTIVYFDITLYPKDQDITRHWHIKYKIKDYTSGKLKAVKYTGLINLAKTVEERNKIATGYIKMLQRGQRPPLFKGARAIPPDGHSLNFANIFNACLNYVKNKKREVDPTTHGHYLSQVNEFGRWLNTSQLQHNAIGSFTKEQARQFLNHLIDTKKLSNKTHNEYKRLLGCIWQDLVDDEKITANPWKKIKRLKQETQSHLSYPPAVRKIIAQKLPAYDPQLYMLVMLQYYCAVRPHGEARLLQAKHLNSTLATITVPKHLIKGKRKDKTRIIPNQLYALLQTGGYFDAHPEHYLFTLQHAPGTQPVSKNYFKNRWRAFTRAFEIPEAYELYGAKHTGGEEMATRFSPFEIKEQMGHDSIHSQESYTKGFDYKKMQALRTAYPDFV